MCSAQLTSRFRFTLADLLCFIAYLGVALSLPICVVRLRQVEEGIPAIDSEVRIIDGKPEVTAIRSYVTKRGQRISSREAALWKIAPLMQSVVLATVGFYAWRRFRTNPGDLAWLRGGVYLRPVAVSSSSSNAPAQRRSWRATATESAIGGLVGIAVMAGLAIALSLLTLSFMWLGPGLTVLVCAAVPAGFAIRALVLGFTK